MLPGNCHERLDALGRLFAVDLDSAADIDMSGTHLLDGFSHIFRP